MEAKLKSLVRYIVSESDGAKSRNGVDGSYFGEFEYKEVRIKLPLEVIEELREWSNEN